MWRRRHGRLRPTRRLLSRRRWEESPWRGRRGVRTLAAAATATALRHCLCCAGPARQSMRRHRAVGPWGSPAARCCARCVALLLGPLSVNRHVPPMTGRPCRCCAAAEGTSPLPLASWPRRGGAPPPPPPPLLGCRQRAAARLSQPETAEGRHRGARHCGRPSAQAQEGAGGRSRPAEPSGSRLRGLISALRHDAVAQSECAMACRDPLAKCPSAAEQARFLRVTQSGEQWHARGAHSSCSRVSVPHGGGGGAARHRRTPCAQPSITMQKLPTRLCNCHATICSL